MSKEKKSSGTGRTRNFATIVYPESAPDNWISLLEEQFVPAFISPLHCEDLNPTGEAKKPHYHVILMFEGVKTIEQAQEIFDIIGGVGCTKVNSLRGYARYLCHLDNVGDKAVYNTSDVISLCGADYDSVIGLSTDKYKAIGEMMDFCEDNNITSYWQLILYARTNNQGWFRVLCDNGTVVIKEYLKSREWTLSKMEDNC